MFNREKINNLEEKLESLEKEYNSLFNLYRDLEWKFENPPIYKVGDKVGDNLITEISTRHFYSILYNKNKDWYYKTFNQKTKEVEGFYQYQLKK